MMDRFRRVAPLAAAGGAAVGVALLAAHFAAPSALADSCQARCDSNYYFCNRGGASPGRAVVRNRAQHLLHALPG